MKLTEHFDLQEFTYSETAKRYGIKNKPKTLIIDNIKTLCEEILEPLRLEIGKPIHISSGYRCLELNKKVGGVPTSQHCLGQACDFVVEGMTPYEVVKVILELNLPFDQVGLYDTFVHISYGERHRRHLFYNKAYKGKQFD
jgi:uncharacterized protein YcbK (DUF882 family)